MSVSSISTYAGGDAAGQVNRVPVQTLGQGDFLKLLVAQMTAQDPLNPKKDTDFIAQMAQFSSLEQTKTMAGELARLGSAQQFSQSAALLGRSVQVQTGPDTTEQGVVSEVKITGGVPQLVVNGEFYSLDQVISVSPAAAQPANSANTSQTSQ